MVLMNNLVGKRVYNQSSYAPSQGTNNAQGYINREINKPDAPQAPQGTQGLYGGVSTFGNDGQSDTRSGIAQQALQSRMGSSLQADPNQTRKTPLATASVPTAVNAIKTALPSIKITPVGKLKLPFNFKYAQGVLEEKRTADAAILKLQQQRQAENRAYMQSILEGAEGYDDTQMESLNDAAGRGVAFSSGYGLKVANDATNYNRFLSQLNTEESDNINEATSGSAAVNNAYKSALAKYANQAGYEFDQKAGTMNKKTVKRAAAVKAANKKKK